MDADGFGAFSTANISSRGASRRRQRQTEGLDRRRRKGSPRSTAKRRRRDAAVVDGGVVAIGVARATEPKLQTEASPFAFAFVVGDVVCEFAQERVGIAVSHRRGDLRRARSREEQTHGPETPRVRVVIAEDYLGDDRAARVGGVERERGGIRRKVVSPREIGDEIREGGVAVRDGRRARDGNDASLFVKLGRGGDHE